MGRLRRVKVTERANSVRVTKIASVHAAAVPVHHGEGFEAADASPPALPHAEDVEHDAVPPGPPRSCSTLVPHLEAVCEQLAWLQAAICPADAAEAHRQIRLHLQELLLFACGESGSDGSGSSARLSGAENWMERSEVAHRPRRTQASASHGDFRGKTLHVAWAPPAVLGSHVHASVGADDASAVDAVSASSLAASLPAPPMGPPAETIDLRAADGPRLLLLSRDVTSLFLGRPAASLRKVSRRRWKWMQLAGVLVCVLSVPAPTLVVFAAHWANGGAGQFALAYEWPLWLEVWWCAGWWLHVCLTLLAYASLQRDLAWMALKQPSTMWFIAMTGVLIAGLVSLTEVGIRRGTWSMLPSYVGLGLAFPLCALADALPRGLRLQFLRFGAPAGLVATAIIAVVLRLPAAEGTPGELVWTVMGKDTVTNLQALTYSSTVLAVLLAEGVVHAWAFPNELAFIRSGVRIGSAP